jgi:diguanylate cyclase (GGDEF)-like protein
MNRATSPRQRSREGTPEQQVPSSTLDDSERVTQSFWLTHMRIGFGVFLGEALVVSVYLARTPHGPHRGVLWVLVAAWMMFGAINLLATPKIAIHSWRPFFSVTWTILSGVAAAIVAQLDGGLRSPLLMLLFLPISFAAWAFTPGAALACGCTCLSASSWIAIADSHGTGPTGTATLLLAVLAGAAVLSVAAARNRQRREKRESALLGRIAELASTDELTGCVVRRVFKERLAEEIDRTQRTGGSLSLMMVDVDLFKVVNDNYGHLVGDSVLSTIGSVLRTGVRSFDLVCRIGGDEFIVLMPDTAAIDAAQLAERVKSRITAEVDIPVTVSIGISELESMSTSAEQLLDRTDLALYRAKRTGRNLVTIQG